MNSRRAVAELTAAAKSIGDQIVKLAAAPIGDNYSGPVLFEGIAAPQLMAEVLGRNLHIARKAVGASGQGSATELEGRRGVRIMPEIFDVIDDPAKPLFGHEEVDDEGVAETALSLVEKGVLKDFLRTRQPVRGYDASNGRARIGGSYGAESAAAHQPDHHHIRKNASDRGSQEEADRPHRAARHALRDHRAQTGFSLLRLDR